MEGGRSPVEVLQTAIERLPVFDELRNGGATRSDIGAALDVSRSTAHRVAKEFESLGIVDHTESRYELTPFGEVVAREAEQSTRTIRVASRLSPLLATMKTAGEHVDLHVFEDATVTEPEPGDPYRPMRRLLSVVEDASRIWEFTPTAPEPAYQTTLYDRVQSELRAAVLYPATVVDQLGEYSAADLEAALATGDFSVRVGEVPEFRLVVADEHVYLSGYNEDASRLRLVADTDDSAAVKWATTCFRNHWQNATPYETHAEDRKN